MAAGKVTFGSSDLLYMECVGHVPEFQLGVKLSDTSFGVAMQASNLFYYPFMDPALLSVVQSIEMVCKCFFFFK